jgi:UDP-glucuronate decarboxylase
VETRIIDLAKLILKLTGSESEIAFHPLPLDDPKRRCPDIGTAKKLLGWKPRIGLTQGLARTITWFQTKNA